MVLKYVDTITGKKTKQSKEITFFFWQAKRKQRISLGRHTADAVLRKSISLNAYREHQRVLLTVRHPVRFKRKLSQNTESLLITKSNIWFYNLFNWWYCCWALKVCCNFFEHCIVWPRGGFLGTSTPAKIGNCLLNIFSHVDHFSCFQIIHTESVHTKMLLYMHKDNKGLFCSIVKKKVGAGLTTHKKFPSKATNDS